MEEGSRRGIYGERIPLCKGCRLAEWREVPGLLAGALGRPLKIFSGGERRGRGRGEFEREQTRGFELSWAASLRREVWMEVFFQVREFSFWA